MTRLCAIHQSSSWLPELCDVSGPEAPWPFNTLLLVHRLDCLCMCVFCDGCWSDRPTIRQEGCVCWVVSSLEGWLIRTSGGCEGCVLSGVLWYAVVLPTLLPCTTTLLSWCCEGRKETFAVGPALEKLFLIAAYPCDLVSVACLLPWIVKRAISASEQQEGSWTSHTRAHSATASQPAIWSGDQPSVAWEIHT